MSFIPETINDYAKAHTSPETDYLYQLYRETYLKTIMPQMVAGHLQGATLRMLSQMIRPKNILEIGTFTGYSAICLAAGLQKGGQLHTIDINEELAAIQTRYFEKAGLSQQIKRYIGNAIELIPQINETFDLVFLDADKVRYPNYYDLVFDKVNPGGYILADNILWSGKVINPKPNDYQSKGIDQYNKQVQQDDRVENVLLPIGDGIMIVRKF